MDSAPRKRLWPVLASIALHSVLLVALIAGMPLSGQRARAPAPAEQQLAIQASVVDETAIEREIAMLERQEQQEILRQQQAEREAREAAEAARGAREEEQRQLEAAREQAAQEERARLAELQRQREAEEQAALEAERRRQAEEQQRLEAERRAREEEERLARLEEERRQREAEEAARQQAALEAELQEALAAEEERRQAERSGLLDQYIRLIENRIEQNWIRPPTARAGLDCVVNVTQIPSGDVINVSVGRCNGDAAVIRSIEAAVLGASPLPRPPSPALFERNLVVTFRPDL